MVQKCIVLNCQSSKGNKNNISMFFAPKDPQLFDAWKLNLPMLRKPLSVSSLVCEKHFHPSDVVSQYTQKLPSEMWIYPRSRKRLKLKAVPISSDISSTPDNTILQDDNERIKANDEVPSESNVDVPIDPYVHKPIECDVDVPIDPYVHIPIECDVDVPIDPYVHKPIECDVDVPIDPYVHIPIECDVDVPIDSYGHKPIECDVHDQIDSGVYVPTKSLLHMIHASTQTVDHEDMEIEESSAGQHSFYKAPFTFNTLLDNLNNIKYPGDCKWAHTVAPDKKTVIFVSIPTDNILRRVEIYDNLRSRVLMEFVHVHQDYLQHNFKNMNQVVDYLTTIYNSKLCATLKRTRRLCFDTACEGIIEQGMGRPRLRCMSCTIKLESTKYRKPPPTVTIRKMIKKKTLQQKVKRCKQKIDSLEIHIGKLRRECGSMEEQAVEDAISNLNESQKTLIRTCLQIAKKTSEGKNGIRYDIKWIYQCLLLKIKGPSLYDSLRNNEILPLPSRQTLHRYISSFDSSFGFKKSIFDGLKNKNLSKPRYERRGVLLVDEIALSKMVAFDQKTLDVLGFVGLGDHTPASQKGQIGDHALVFMFQPFRGTWVQTLGCFLSKGATPSDTLKELTLECITKLEDADLLVDAVTTDGASWNRAMWTKFNVDDKNVCCSHPCDDNRKLWFISDFPHLIKNLRNRIVEKKIFTSPSGVIKLSHWDEVLKADNPDGYNLKVCPGLTYNVIHPKPFQKMNVRRAFRFFSIAAGMELFKTEGIPGLQDADPSIELLKIVNNVVRIMNSKSPGNSLKWDSDDRKELENFLDYLNVWEKIVLGDITDDRKRNVKSIKSITNSTLTGLRVTIRATLDLQKYLFDLEGDNLSYIMTCRLNQDALERFFSIIRTACGNNSHPTPVAFAQAFRLLSVYSLIKPPKGSNVNANEMLITLLKPEDINSKTEVSGKQKLISQLESILENQATYNDDDDVDVQNLIVEPFDHDYARQYTSDEVKSYVSGYIARRIKKFTKCESCISSLTTDESSDRDKLIELKSRGKLLKASDSLYQIIAIAENLILYTVYEEDLSVDLLSHIFSALEDTKFPNIGCDEHDLRSQILSYFIIFRMNTLCHRYNDIHLSSNREKTQMYTKIAKL